MAYLALPPLFLVVLVFAAGIGFMISAIVPLLPDVRFVIEQVLSVVMFLSGVVFSLSNVPPPLSDWLALNPVAQIMDATRGILMHGAWPHWAGLLKVSLISIVVCLVGAAVVRHFAPRYPKLAS